MGDKKREKTFIKAFWNRRRTLAKPTTSNLCRTRKAERLPICLRTRVITPPSTKKKKKEKTLFEGKV